MEDKYNPDVLINYNNSLQKRNSVSINYSTETWKPLIDEKTLNSVEKISNIDSRYFDLLNERDNEKKKLSLLNPEDRILNSFKELKLSYNSDKITETSFTWGDINKETIKLSIDKIEALTEQIKNL